MRAVRAPRRASRAMRTTERSSTRAFSRSTSTLSLRVFNAISCGQFPSRSRSRVNELVRAAPRCLHLRCLNCSAFFARRDRPEAQQELLSAGALLLRGLRNRGERQMLVELREQRALLIVEVRQVRAEKAIPIEMEQPEGGTNVGRDGIESSRRVAKTFELIVESPMIACEPLRESGLGRSEQRCDSNVLLLRVAS